MHLGKTKWELHKNATSYLEQILKATPHETMAVRSLTSYLKTNPSKMTWDTAGKVRTDISNVLQWPPPHGCVSVGWPERTYLHQLCMDTGCNLEDLPRVTDDGDGWREENPCCQHNLMIFFLYCKSPKNVCSVIRSLIEKDFSDRCVVH